MSLPAAQAIGIDRPACHSLKRHRAQNLVRLDVAQRLRLRIGWIRCCFGIKGKFRQSDVCRTLNTFLRAASKREENR